MFDFVSEIAPGVRGYTVDLGARGLYVPLVEAVELGNGDVGRFLNSLPTNRRVVFPNVISGKLDAMLRRRGFHDEWEYSEQFEESVPLLVRDVQPDA